MEDFLMIMFSVAFGCLFGIAAAELFFWNHLHPPKEPDEPEPELDEEPGHRINIYM